MHYCNIKPCDIADGPGVRVTLFVSGCRNHCKNCFQPETWAFDYGEPFTEAVEDFLRRVRRDAPNKTIWCYSGFTWEQLTGQEPSRCRCEVTDEFLSLLDVLVDGPYVEELHDITLLFRGSSNQRLIHVPESLKCGRITLWTP